VEHAPSNAGGVYFTTGGAESNESAFKVARYYWKLKGQPDKVKIISRRWGYHGVTMAAGSATGLPVFHKMYAPLVPNFVQTVGAYRYRCELEEGGPRPCTDRVGHDYAAALEQTLIAEGPGTVAAILAEPIAGAGGVIPPPDDYWPKLRAIADRHQVLIIADEIITGFGRTGKWFGLQNWDVAADIFAFAKGVTSGYVPLGGIVVSKEIQAAINSAPGDMKFTQAGTYSGHPVACAVGVANLEIIEREGLVERAAELAPLFQERLSQLGSIPQVGDVRGIGLMGGVELVDRSQAGVAFYDGAVGHASRVFRNTIDHGLIARLRGNVVVLAPPLVSSEDQIDRIVNILGESIKETAQ